MSWSLSASGHAADERAEALLIDRLRAVMTSQSTGCGNATMYTQHHGAVNLLDTDGIARDETVTYASGGDGSLIITKQETG